MILSRILLATLAMTWLGATQPAFAYYNPVSGRWLNRDPLSEHGGLHLSAFVHNRPTSDTDALGLRAEPRKRDLNKYRTCRRAALDARLTQGGVGPGDYRRDCCQKITVIIKLPLCTASGFDGKGLGGHTGIGVEEEFFDYGPDVRNRRGLPSTKGNLLTGTPGSQWWDDPALWDGAQSPADVGLPTVLGDISTLARDGSEPLDVFKIEIAVSASEAGKVRDYWNGRYRDPGTYSVLGNQCTSTVMDSLDRAGIWDRPFLTFKPIGFLKGLETAVHTCGPNKGQRVRMELINRERGPLNCGKP